MELHKNYLISIIDISILNSKKIEYTFYLKNFLITNSYFPVFSATYCSVFSILHPKNLSH